MKRTKIIKIISALAGVTLLAAGCSFEARTPNADVAVNPNGDVYVDTAPPALLAETPPPAPGPDYVWIGGDWVWRDNRWDWEHGRWDRPPHAGMHWAPNRYEERHGHHVFIHGDWR